MLYKAIGYCFALQHCDDDDRLPTLSYTTGRLNAEIIQ